MTKGLETMGVSIVDQSLITSNSFNEKGYWEDPEIHEFNIQLINALEPLEHRWRSILPLAEKEVDFLCGQKFLEQGKRLLLSKLGTSSQPLGLKDPRFSILLPFWKRVFKACELRVSFIVLLRDPFSTIASMKAFSRECEPINDHDEKFLWAWISFLVGCLENTAGEECVYVHYDKLLKDPVAQIERIARVLNLEVQEDVLKKYHAEFIDPKLCHFKMAKISGEPLTPSQALAWEMYEQLLWRVDHHLPVSQLQRFLKKWKAELAAVEPLLKMAEKNEQTILLLQAAVLVYRDMVEKNSKNKLLKTTGL